MEQKNPAPGESRDGVLAEVSRARGKDLPKDSILQMAAQMQGNPVECLLAADFGGLVGVTLEKAAQIVYGGGGNGIQGFVC